MFKIEKGGPLSVTLNNLKLLHQFPDSFERSYLRKFFARFYAIRIACFIFTTIGPISHLIVSIIGDRRADITEDVTVSLGATSAGMISLVFTVKFKEWNEFFKDLTDVKEYGKPEKFDETVHRLNRYGKIAFFAALWVTIIYGSASLFNSIDCDKVNEGKNFSEVCPVLVPIWLPFGGNNLKVGAVVFILQIFCVGFGTAQVFMSICFTVYESTEILICHISSLEGYFKTAFDGSSVLEMEDKFRFCIRYHIYLIKLTDRLCSLIKYTIGHTAVFGAIVCGCVANQLTRTKPLGSLIYLAAWLISLFGFCHSGQRIQDKTMSIGDAVWKSKWYKADVATKKSVKFVLQRCQKPICYEALPLGVLDYPFYLMMVKTGYSYFTLFNQQEM